MNTPVAVTEHQWSSPELPLLSLSVSASELAQAFGIPLQSWSEDGLGQAHGFACRLPSGFVVLVQELEHAREHLGEKGATVLLEYADLAAREVASAIEEVLAAFGLAAHHVTWIQSEANARSLGRH
ncbi:hypothetical protein GCM10007918_11710 [Piscinibacter gummiphilus]|nr:hypothetical protein GCM10007918_11710 [Piscinibacter gummiphilus]